MIAGSARRRASPLLLGCVRRLSTTANAQAAPAVVDKPSGLLSMFFGTPRVQTPMTEELPGYQIPPPVGPPSSEPETESTTLTNGIKVVSEATHGPTSSVGIYIDTGSVYETAQTTGASNLLEYMAFKATPHRSSFRVMRELESIGANAVASASREQLAYSADVIRSNTAEITEVLIDTVLNPKFNPWEVAEQIYKLKEDLKKYSTNHMGVMQEGLHAVAYQGALGRPLVCPEDCIGKLNANVLHDYIEQNFTPNRIVIAGSGMGHNELVSLAEPLVSSLKPSGQTEQPPSTYIGGDFRQFKSEPMTHSALAFELEGGWRDTKGAVTATVLQYLLGGGGSFSSGGPGKGMHSRLYRNVLNSYFWMHNCIAFSSLYNDTGILGIMASADSQYAGQSVDVMCKEMLALTKNVSKEDLDRAKNAAINQVLTNLESRAVIAEDIGRQVLTYGHRKPVGEFLDAIKALQPADISKLAQKLFKKPVTYGAIGDVASMPRYEEVSGRFR